MNRREVLTANEPDDEAVVRAVLEGDAQAFAVLVRRYRRAAIVRACAVTGDSTDAEDIAQESFVTAYVQIAACRHPDRFGAWLLTIVRHKALNHARARQRRRTEPLKDDVADVTDRHATSFVAEAGAERGGDRARLVAALRLLTPMQREVVLLADLEGLSHAAIAERTGVSVLMSRRHLSDARQRLRQSLSPDPFTRD